MPAGRRYGCHIAAPPPGPTPARAGSGGVAGAALFAGLDTGALAAVGVDLDAVRDRIEASFGAGALTRVDSGPVPPILSALGAPAPSLRAAILDRCRQAD